MLIAIMNDHNIFISVFEEIEIYFGINKYNPIRRIICFFNCLGFFFINKCTEDIIGNIRVTLSKTYIAELYIFERQIKSVSSSALNFDPYPVR